MIEGNMTAAVFIGSSGGDSRKIASNLLRPVHEGLNMTPDQIEKTNILWSAADMGALLAKKGIDIITGGYYEGELGMASWAANRASRRFGTHTQQFGPVFEKYFPGDPNVIDGELIQVYTNSERLGIYFKKADAFILMAGGGLGTLAEIFGAFKDDTLRHEIVTYGTHADSDNLNLRPFIVVDPTEKTQELLKFIFNSFIGQERCQGNQIITDLMKRIYIFGPEAFVDIPTHKNYPRLKRLKPESKNQIINILNQYSKIGGTVIANGMTFYDRYFDKI